MQSVGFVIHAIENGWFEAEFRTFSKGTAISASDKWGNDAPKHLIKLINQLISNKIKSGYVTFDETPGTYVLYIDNSENTAFVYIFYSTEETCHWKDFPAYGEISLSELISHIPIKESLFFAEINPGYLADSLYKAFEAYTDKKHRTLYEENWGLFPTKEFNKLELLTQQTSYPHMNFVPA